MSGWREVLIPGPPLPALHVTAVPRGPPAHPADAESGERGMRGWGAGVGPGWGYPHSVLPLPPPSRSLLWASPAPSPSSLAPWNPPRVLRVSREAPAAATPHPLGPQLQVPRPCCLLVQNHPPTAHVHPGECYWPEPPSFCPHFRASKHGPDAESDTSTGHGQCWTPGEGWARRGGARQGLPPTP